MNSIKKIAVIGLSGQSVFMEVEHFHREGETVSARSLFEEPGGKGYNQAVAARRFGADVSYLSAVGKDTYGDICEEYMKNEGIRGLFVRKNTPTAFASILTDSNGENRVTVFSGATILLDENDVLLFENEIKTASLLLLQLEVPECVNLKSIELAKKYATPYIINPAPSGNITASILAAMKDAMIITPNGDEAAVIFGEYNSDKELVERIAASGYKNAAVTLGSRGALIYEDGKTSFVKSENVTAVDTTGAGDVFTAALSCAIVNGKSIYEAAEYASKAATASVTGKHVLNSIVNL